MAKKHNRYAGASLDYTRKKNAGKNNNPYIKIRNVDEYNSFRSYTPRKSRAISRTALLLLIICILFLAFVLAAFVITH